MAKRKKLTLEYSDGRVEEYPYPIEFTDVEKGRCFICHKRKAVTKRHLCEKCSAEYVAIMKEQLGPLAKMEPRFQELIDLLERESK